MDIVLCFCSPSVIQSFHRNDVIMFLSVSCKEPVTICICSTEYGKCHAMWCIHWSISVRDLRHMGKGESYSDYLVTSDYIAA